MFIGVCQQQRSGESANMKACPSLHCLNIFDTIVLNAAANHEKPLAEVKILKSQNIMTWMDAAWWDLSKDCKACMSQMGSFK